MVNFPFRAYWQQDSKKPWGLSNEYLCRFSPYHVSLLPNLSSMLEIPFGTASALPKPCAARSLGLKIDFPRDPFSNAHTMRIGPNPVGTVSALIALAGITHTISTQAAIVVSSVSNLEIPPGESTTVDFDGNGTPEFYFFYANSQVILETYDNSAVSIYNTDTGRLEQFPLGSPITTGQPTTVFGGAELPLAEPFYGGFQFQIDGSTHLGWFQMENTGELSVVRIVNAAWQTLPETGINAGAVPELPATPLVFGTVAGMAFWWLRRPTRSGHGSP